MSEKGFLSWMLESVCLKRGEKYFMVGVVYVVLKEKTQYIIPFKAIAELK